MAATKTTTKTSKRYTTNSGEGGKPAYVKVTIHLSGSNESGRYGTKTTPDQVGGMLADYFSDLRYDYDYRYAIEAVEIDKDEFDKQYEEV